MKDLLTKQDINQFAEMCDSGVSVKRSECDLYKEYYEHVVEGQTQFAEVSIGMTTNKRDQEDEATGWGGYRTDVAQHFFCCIAVI
jgi:hypothetical protein